jgi:hypothetical protein
MSSQNASNFGATYICKYTFTYLYIYLFNNVCYMFLSYFVHLQALIYIISNQGRHGLNTNVICEFLRILQKSVTMSEDGQTMMKICSILCSADTYRFLSLMESFNLL